MKNVIRTLTIINIISLCICVGIQFILEITIYNEYIDMFLKIVTILVGITSIVSAIIAFRDKNILISVLQIVVMLLTLPITFFRNANYITLFIPLIIAIINLVLIIRMPDKDKINVIAIIAIVAVALIEIIAISIPMQYASSSLTAFEKALPEIRQLSSYRGKRDTENGVFYINIDGKNIRIKYKDIGKESIFTSSDGKELFRIKSLSEYGDAINFMNYILGNANKYGITLAIN